MIQSTSSHIYIYIYFFFKIFNLLIIYIYIFFFLSIAVAAPGRHIPYLHSLFPNKKFILIDPSPFSISEAQNRIIIQDYFTD